MCQIGYSHYIADRKTFTDSDWKQLTNAAKILVSNAQLFGSDGTGKPIIDESDIMFNGDKSKDEDHETFHLSKCKSDWDCCKTAQKPYDDQVTAILCIASFLAPDALKVTSDGDKSDWQEGLRLAQTIYPEATIPKGIR